MKPSSFFSLHNRNKNPSSSDMAIEEDEPDSGTRSASTEMGEIEKGRPTSTKTVGCRNLSRHDSLTLESRKLHCNNNAAKEKGGGKRERWWVMMQLAFQSIGVVYGDIGTSPLYVYPSTFTEGISHNDDILAVLSLILYTLTLIPLIKYVFIVLHANDNGDGGTFALYSLMCRYAKVGLLPSQEAEDREVSSYRLELPSKGLRRASNVRSRLEHSTFAKYFLLLATMLGTSMVIGDGVLTPCISVLSAVGGLKDATSSMTEGRIVWASVGILVVLFMVQRFGTDKVGNGFAPIICIWFLLIGGIGLYNIFAYDPSVLKALNPFYIFRYFSRDKKRAWISLGGIVLSTTGTEALFADVGHFSVRSIQISMCGLTYPALLFAYIGQASFLSKNKHAVADAFYKSTPDRLYWFVFVIAVMASIVASQAMISGTFSVVQQSLSLGCFPRVSVVHTSAKFEGQVYIPEINYLLMLACVCVTIGFRTTTKIGSAYGIAVVLVMTLTSGFLVLIMVVIWKTNIALIVTYVLIIGSVELLYLSSVLYKFNQGGYLPLVFAMVLMAVMYTWNYVYRRKYYYELENKISPEMLQEMIVATNSSRIRGLAVFYSELVHGIPPIFGHYIANVPALHSVLVFVSFKSLPVSRVDPSERFLLRRVYPRELYVFRCVVRYGYMDVRGEEEEVPFEMMLVGRLKEFIREESGWESVDGGTAEGEAEMAEQELATVEMACGSGVVHLIGENEVVAGKGAGLWKRGLVDYGYNFLKRNLTQSEKVFLLPHKRMLKVGMTYEL